MPLDSYSELDAVGRLRLLARQSTEATLEADIDALLLPALQQMPEEERAEALRRCANPDTRIHSVGRDVSFMLKMPDIAISCVVCSHRNPGQPRNDNCGIRWYTGSKCAEQWGPVNVPSCLACVACCCRVLVEEGQQRLAWSTAFLTLEARRQRAFTEPSGVAEATLACVGAWETTTDFDRIVASLDAASAALQVRSRVQGTRESICRGEHEDHGRGQLLDAEMGQARRWSLASGRIGSRRSTSHAGAVPLHRAVYVVHADRAAKTAKMRLHGRPTGTRRAPATRSCWTACARPSATSWRRAC